MHLNENACVPPAQGEYFVEPRLRVITAAGLSGLVEAHLLSLYIPNYLQVSQMRS